MRASAQGLNLVDSVYERLLSERIIFLGSQVDDDIANRLCAQILLLAAEDSSKDIHAVHQLARWIDQRRHGDLRHDGAGPVRHRHLRMGMAASMGEFLLAAGTKGKRYALPHAAS